MKVGLARSHRYLFCVGVRDAFSHKIVKVGKLIISQMIIPDASTWTFPSDSCYCFTMLDLIPATPTQPSTHISPPIIPYIFSQTRIIYERSSQFDRRTHICTCGVSSPGLIANLLRSHCSSHIDICMAGEGG